MDISKRVRIDRQVFDNFPDYEAVVVYAGGIDNQTPSSWTEAMLREAESLQREHFQSRPLESERLLTKWREAYLAFGSKPNKYQCSPEAMLRRVLKSQSIPTINPVVDLYNAVSLKHLIPIGGEDLDAVIGSPVLTIADGSEPFLTGRDVVVVEHPDVGEVVWLDDEGVTCRRWNWRQCRRTAITQATYDAYFVLDGWGPVTEPRLDLALRDLLDGLARLNSETELVVERVSAEGAIPR